VEIQFEHRSNLAGLVMLVMARGETTRQSTRLGPSGHRYRRSTDVRRQPVSFLGVSLGLWDFGGTSWNIFTNIFTNDLSLR
jgi:hypothetical protein